MDVISRRVVQQYPDVHDWTIRIRRFDDWFVGDDLRTALSVLMGAVVLVLLIVCANVANLRTDEVVYFKAMETGACVEQDILEGDFTWVKKGIPLVARHESSWLRQRAKAARRSRSGSACVRSLSSRLVRCRRFAPMRWHCSGSRPVALANRANIRRFERAQM